VPNFELLLLKHRDRLLKALYHLSALKCLKCLVTEALDNNGLPHTLEHLIFMGSKKYPYKGVLDLIANRCMASGTNAFTAQDHTAYELTTVSNLLSY
ncbi:unnamed protein product, partial [Brugia pahangi]|uniref:Peptidase_M16 domain-containing protein n=1 Tax=Brugia pahangi TaxID=6280 RepID=A0A0N4TGR7_BRUPA